MFIYLVQTIWLEDNAPIFFKPLLCLHLIWYRLEWPMVWTTQFIRMIFSFEKIAICYAPLKIFNNHGHCHALLILCTPHFPLSKLNKVTQIIHTNQNLWEMQESKLKFTQSWFPTWNTFLCIIINQHICDLLKHWSKTKMLAAPHDCWPTIHPEPIINNTKQQSTWPSTYKNDFNYTCGISIFNMLTFQEQNSKM